MSNDPGTEKIGLAAVWKNENFVKGQTEYVSKLNEAIKVTDTASKGTAGAAESAGKMTGAMGALAAVTGLSIAGMVTLGATIAVGVGAFKLIEGVISTGIDLLKTYGWEALNVASRVEQLGYIAQILAQRQGMAGESVVELVDKLNKQGIALGEANNLVAQFARYNLDLSKASQLAAVAQDAATLANESTSESLAGIIHGLVVLSPIVLRHHGIMVDFSQAYDRYAAIVGKTADELTQMEKVQAGLNAILENGTTIQGAYKVSMESAGKQMKTLTGRLIPDLLTQLGMPFQSAFFNVITAINEVVKGVTELFKQGGALYPVMIKLGGLFAFLTEPLAALGKAFFKVSTEGTQDFKNMSAEYAKTGVEMVETTDNWIVAIVDRIIGAVTGAFEWGFNLITNFAIGMAEAAGSVLSAVLTGIANMLTWWFSPGSPPNIAPEIDLWGLKTAEEWLKGFQEADFDLLKQLQNPLKDVFSILADMGVLKKGDAGKLWADISEQMIQVIATGKGLDELLQRLSENTDVFSVETIELIKRQFEVAKAIDEVTNAENRLKAAQEREIKTGLKVNQIKREYNDMLRGGASRSTLQAKLNELNLAKKEQDQAKNAVTQEEKRFELAKQQLQLMQTQAAIQEELLRQMLEIAKAQLDLQKQQEIKIPGMPGMPKGGGGGKPIPTSFELPTSFSGAFDPDALFDPIREAVKKAKEDIRQQWQDMLDTIERKWHEKIDPLTTAITTAWKTIRTALGLDFEGIALDFQAAMQWIDAQIIWFTTLWEGWWAAHGENVRIVWDFAWEAIKTKINFDLNHIRVLIVMWQNLLEPIITAFWEKVKGVLATKWEEIKAQFQIFLEGMGLIFDIAAALIETDWSAAWEKLKTDASAIWDQITGLWQIAVDMLGSIWDGFVAKVEKAWGWIQGIMGKGAEDTVGVVQDVYELDSPSKVFARIGENLMKGLEMGILSEQAKARGTIAAGVTTTASPISRLPITAGESHRTLNFNMGGVTVNNGMDMALFSARVKSVVRQEMRR